MPASHRLSRTVSYQSSNLDQTWIKLTTGHQHEVDNLVQLSRRRYDQPTSGDAPEQPYHLIVLNQFFQVFLKGLDLALNHFYRIKERVDYESLLRLFEAGQDFLLHLSGS